MNCFIKKQIDIATNFIKKRIDTVIWLRDERILSAGEYRWMKKFDISLT